MKKFLKIISVFVLLASVVVGIYLVSNTNKSLDVRKSAYYGNSTFVFLPSEVANLAVGDTFTFELMLDVGDKELTGMDIKLKYDQEKLSVVGNPEPLIAPSQADYGHYLFHSVDDVFKNQLDVNAGTINLIGAVSGGSAQTLPTGVVHLLRVQFRAEVEGSATIDIDDGYQNIITGNNPDSYDDTLFSFELAGVVYVIVATSGQSGWGEWSDCSVSCGGGTQSRTCEDESAGCEGESERECNTQSCSEPIDGGWSVGDSCSLNENDVCMRVRTCTNPVPSNGGDDCTGDAEEICDTSECSSEAVDGGWSDWIACTKECDSGIQRRNCDSPEPVGSGSMCEREDGSLGLSETKDCNTQACDDGTPKLSFDFTFAGVRAGSKCVANKKVDVMVLKGSQKEIYEDVVVVAGGEENSRKETIFRVSGLDISGDFSDMTGLAVFVKGPKHLQMKFGEDGQKEYYNQAGGQINVEAGKVFDFSEYSLMAGDVNRDGTVDAVDFVEIKKRAAVFETTKEGEESQYDLDGSCMVNTVDMALLVQSLNEKFDQVY